MTTRVSGKPIVIPPGVEVSLDADGITIKGSLGKLYKEIRSSIKVSKTDAVLSLFVVKASLEANSLAGSMRSIIDNMVKGVSEGFSVKLLLVGVGYRAKADGSDLNLSIGFSHPVVMKMPSGVFVETPSNTEILLKGSDKQLVNQIAANIRSLRPPEPYKGKGIRYENELITLKEGKKK